MYLVEPAPFSSGHEQTVGRTAITEHLKNSNQVEEHPPALFKVEKITSNIKDPGGSKGRLIYQMK